jgi:SAM-dependent methyltransferase
MAADNEQADFWNEEGGERWVENIERLETMLSSLSARLIAQAAPRSGEQVLDIGCGGGVTSAAIAEATGDSGGVVGADISEIILNVARGRYAHMTNLEFTTADAGTFAFEAGGYDLITSRFGVMFFPDPDVAFSNIYRAGKSGGRIVFLCWRALPENPWMGAPVAAAFTVLTPPEKPEPGAPGPFSLADPERVRRILGGAGFVDVKLSPIDETVNLGEVEPALDFMTKMGPAADPLKDAPADLRTKAIAAMRAVLEEKNTEHGVVMPSAVWLVEAWIP